MTVSLARANIAHEWKLFLAAILILTLSGCLIYVAVGIMASNIRSFSAFEQSLDVDLHIQQTQSLDSKARGRFSGEIIYQIREYADVAAANISATHSFQTAISMDDDEDNVYFRVLEPEVNRLTIPKIISEKEMGVLNQVGNVILTQATQKKLNLKIGDKLKVKNTDVQLTLAGILYGDLGAANLIGISRNNLMGLETARLINPNTSPPSITGKLNNVLVKLKDGSNVYEAKARLNHYLKSYNLEAVLPNEKQNGNAWKALSDSKALQGFFVVGVFATLIPLVIVIQTLRSAIMAQKIQFATLRAIGIPVWRIVLIALEQAIWVGIFGAAIAYCFALIIQMKLFEHDILMLITNSIAINISIALISCAIFAGFISLFAISKTKPQELLR